MRSPIKGSDLIGRPISDAEMRGRGGVVIVAIRHADGTMDRSPDSDFLLASGDTIFVLGHSDHVLSIARRAGSDRTLMFRGAKA